MNKKETVVWAIDPFEKETRPAPSLVSKLLKWAQSSDLQIQPVYILSLQLGESADFLEGMGLSPVPAAEKVSESYLQDLGVTGVLPVKVIFAGAPSRKTEVDALLDFAEKHRSPCIVVSSHGRSGVGRLMLGSFAETLLARSSCPIFFLTHLKPEGKDEKEIKRVLFSTDFSDSSRKAFQLFLSQAKRFHFDLTLFHSVSLPASVMGSGYGEQVVLPEDYFTQQLKWAQIEGEQWAKLAESYGVHTRFIVKDEGVGAKTGKTILTVAQEQGAGLIAMASKSGTISSFVMGSVARDVFRSNSYPVWICGPRVLERKHEHRDTGESISA